MPHAQIISLRKKKTPISCAISGVTWNVRTPLFMITLAWSRCRCAASLSAWPLIKFPAFSYNLPHSSLLLFFYLRWLIHRELLTVSHCHVSVATSISNPAWWKPVEWAHWLALVTRVDTTVYSLDRDRIQDSLTYDDLKGRTSCYIQRHVVVTELNGPRVP